MTPAINLLKKLKIPHKLYPYECDAHDDFGKHAATRLGLPEGFSVLDPADAGDVMVVVRDEVLKDLPHSRRFPR